MRPVAFWCFVVVAGCSKGSKVEDFSPHTDNARAALEAALQHWQGGGIPGPVPGTTPATDVVDSRWKSGQKLMAFEVLGEESNGTGPRTFKVRLTVGKGPPSEAKYVIVGIDPLLVYRDEDFKKLSGMGM